VASFGVPASIDDLRGHGVVAFDDSLKAVPGALWLGAEARGARVELRASSTNSALNACLAGIGIACIPCFLGDPEPTLQRLTPEVLGVREMFVVVHPDLARVARVRTVMDHLVDVMTANATLLGGLRS
jgi:DNA-binding transcriptional LysR family regulator